MDGDVSTKRMLDFGEGDNENKSPGRLAIDSPLLGFCEGDNENNSPRRLAIGSPSNILEEKTPKIGMEFDSEEATYQFYNEYAKAAGFGIRRHRVHRDENKRILDRIFCCDHQGLRPKDKRDVLVVSHRRETRTDYCAQMKINCRYSSKYRVVDLTIDHKGHDLVSPKKAHMLKSHRRMTVIQASQADDLDYSGIAPRAGFTLFAKQAGGRDNVGFMLDDYKNYLHSKRTRESRKGETGGVMEYLQQRQLNDPQFFYAVQLDEDDLITNILWVDSRMKYDYRCFGDVVCFDTTHKKNKDGRPFALFVGVNHHKQTIVFGAALLFDETASTFVWLFDTFAKAMSGKEPMTILTDQDAAMAKALSLQWPKTSHRLCIWHIYQNAANHLCNVFASCSNFSKDFTFCIYDYEEEELFFNAWEEMLKKYELESNDWLLRLFNIREKWALVYGRQIFCADMTSTQRSESMHSSLKKYVSYKHNLLQFFHHFDRLVADRRYNELKADLWTSQSSPSIVFPIQILKHAARIYTHEVFELVQDELRKSYDSQVELCGEIEDNVQYKVITFRKQTVHIVLLHSSQCTVTCSCKKFEFAGILCSHILKVFSWKNIMEIPEQYIKKRWTKKANKYIFETQPEKVDQELFEFVNGNDDKKLTEAQYRELCSLTNQLATRAALTVEIFQIARKGLRMLIEEVDANSETSMKPNLGSKSVVGKAIVSRVVPTSTSNVHENVLGEDMQSLGEIKVKGLKQKEKKPVKSGKRLKSSLEKNQRKSRRSNVVTKKKDQIHSCGGENSTSIGASFQNKSLPSSSQSLEENGVVGNNLDMIPSSQQSSLSYANQIQSPQIFNTSIHQQSHFAPWNDHPIETSFTYLLQQGKPQSYGEFYVNNFSNGSQHN